MAGTAANAIRQNAEAHRNRCRIIFLMSRLLLAAMPDVNYALFSELHPNDKERSNKA